MDGGDYMTWQTKFPLIAEGLERITEKKAFVQRTARQYKKTTPEEDKARLREKKERLRETHPDVFKSLPEASEPDWEVLLRPREPFKK